MHRLGYLLDIWSWRCWLAFEWQCLWGIRLKSLLSVRLVRLLVMCLGRVLHDRLRRLTANMQYSIILR